MDNKKKIIIAIAAGAAAVVGAAVAVAAFFRKKAKSISNQLDYDASVYYDDEDAFADGDILASEEESEETEAPASDEEEIKL